MIKRFFKFLGIMSLMNLSLMLCQVKVQQISSSCIQENRKIFINFWTNEYQDYSLSQLGIDSLQAFLHKLFDQEEFDCQKDSDRHLFFQMKEGDQVVGYISFDVDHDRSVYIRQWAFASEYCNVENLSTLIFSIFDQVPNVSYLYVYLRNLAIKSILCLSDIGFNKVSGDLKEYDAMLYSCYKLSCSDKCGTCFCECEEDDLVDIGDLDGEEQKGAVYYSFEVEREVSCGCSG